MKIMLLFFILCLNLLYSKELALDTLLEKYEDSASLYKETKRDASGYIITFSRKDLDRMQAFTLKDVLKTIRLFSLQIDDLGALQLKKTGQGKNSMAPVKLYIDGYEVTSVLQTNALDMYANMDLYFIDHIEVYQSSSSFAFGNMPGTMVIRLYSKKPSRENSTSMQFSIDSKNGHNLSIIDAKTAGEYQYLIYADKSDIKYDSYIRNSHKLSRNAKRYQTHFKLSKKNDYDLDIDAIRTKRDIFTGFGSTQADGNSIRAYGYINFIKYFKNDIRLLLSTSLEKQQIKEKDNSGIKLFNNNIINYFQAKALSKTYKAIVEKKIVHDNSDFLLGFQFQRNIFDLEDYNIGNNTLQIGAKSLNMYMLYAEELYNINQNNLLALSAKVDHYRNSLSQNSTDYSLRIGYISHLFNNKIKTKIFLNRLYLYPIALQSSFAPPTYQPNTNLKNATIHIATGEAQYLKGKNCFIFGYAYKTIDDAITFNKQLKKYVNKNSRVHFNRIYLRDIYKFNIDNKLVIGYYKGYRKAYASPGSGYVVQLFNKMGKFDLYNELLYREGYDHDFGAGIIHIDDGYDYSCGITYPYSKHLTLKLKGENLLNKANKTPIDAQGLIRIPAIQKRVIVSMEYTF